MSYVLVVEDDHDIRLALEDLLADAGRQARSARSGLEALALLEGPDLPSLILLDLMMPGMDGYEFRRRQLLEPRLAAIPVVVLTADRRIKPDGLPGARVLFKPFTTEQLLALLPA